MLFFQPISRGYEHASTVLTSKKSVEEWGEIFGDEVMVVVLVDRLLLSWEDHTLALDSVPQMWYI